MYLCDTILEDETLIIKLINDHGTEKKKEKKKRKNDINELSPQRQRRL